MDELIKFNNQTAGRDKVFRLVQYTSRIIWHSLSQRKSCHTSVEKAKSLDASLGLARRLLRFGRFYETLHSALPVMSSVSDPVVRMTCVLSRISNSCFMIIDHIVCLDKLGLLPLNLIDASRWDRTSTRFWLYSITLGLIRDFYEILRIYKEEFPQLPRSSKRLSLSSKTPISLSNPKNSSNPDSVDTSRKLLNNFSNLRKNAHVVELVELSRVLNRCVRDHADVTVDTVKNLCDIFLPLNTLGFVKLSPATIGLLGVISTLVSTLPMINPMIKMVPSM